MRKLILAGLLAATTATGFVPAIATAQTRDLRDARRDLREEQRDLRDAQRYGTRRDVREQRRDVRDARREVREEWRDHRDRNRALYRRPAYVGPVQGWRYRPIAVGHRFEPSYYGQRYWISDPYRYRLPAAQAGTRWIRYGNDVALVNMRNGRVLRVYDRFFW